MIMTYVKNYLKQRWIPIAVRTDEKAPIYKGWQETKEEEVEELIGNALVGAGKANIGIITGMKTGLFVIDIDVKDEGMIYWKELEEEYGKVVTLIARTPNGGLHYYFRMTEDLKRIKERTKLWGKGVDIRSDGNFIIAQPSEYEWGKYEFINNKPISKVPEWLKAKIKEYTKEKKKGEKRKNEKVSKILNKIYKVNKEWEITKEDESIKIISDGSICLREPKSGHKNQKEHSCIFINENNIVVSCRSHGNKSITKRGKWGELFRELRPNKEKVDEPKKKEEREKCIIDKDIMEIIEEDCTSGDIGRYIVKRLNGVYVCVERKKKNVRMYKYNGVRWEEDIGQNELHRFIRDKVTIDIREMREGLPDKGYNKEYSGLKEIEKRLKSIGKRESYINEIGNMLYDKNFIKMLDTKGHLIGFENGVYDLKEKKFREGQKEDYISITTGYEYKESNGVFKEELNKFLRKVYPKETIRRYILDILAQCLSGDIMEHALYTNTGCGSNGKTRMNDFITIVLGEYAIEMQRGYLNQKNATNVGDPFTAELRGKRYVYVEEPATDGRMNSELVKSITGGGKIKGRLLYSNIIEDFAIMFKLFVYCNKKLRIDGDDGGIQRRIRVVQYESIFDKVYGEKITEDDYEKNLFVGISDRELRELFEKWKYEFLGMLMERYEYGKKIETPKEVREESIKYLESNNEIKQFIMEEGIERGGETDYIKLKEIYGLWKCGQRTRLTISEFKESMEKELGTECIDRSRMENKRVRNIFVGWKIINEENERCNLLDQ